MRIRFIALLIIALGLAAALVNSMGPANAAQQQNAYLYSHWTFDRSGTGYWNVDQDMKIDKRATATYWAQLWDWKGASFGGYLGVQTNGSRGDGTTGDTAIFSLWNANAATGPHCVAFNGEGNGLSCRLTYPIGTSAFYRYRLWRLAADSGGQWSGAWIQNTSNGTDTYLGSIRVAAQYSLITDVQNFAEYFGTAVACNRVPRSTVEWTQPAANSRGNGLYDYSSSYFSTSTDRGACTGGSSTPINLGRTRGVRVVLGG